MVQQCEVILRCAKRAGVETCLLVSLIGCEDTNVAIAQKFKQVQDLVHRSGIQNCCVVQRGFIQNSMFWYAPMVQEQRKLGWPLHGDQGKFAPLNLWYGIMIVSSTN